MRIYELALTHPRGHAKIASFATEVGTMLKRIHIHNYKTFVNFDWILPRTCVLVGKNGAGKTALIEILWVLRELVVEGKRIEETALPASRTAWLAEVEQIVEIEIDHDGHSFLYRLECLQGKRAPEVRERLVVGNTDVYRSGDGKVELFGDDPSREPRATIPFDRRRSFISVLESRPNNQRIVSFRAALESLWRLKPDPARMGSVAAGESDRLAPDLSNFADWYRAQVQEDPEASTALQVDLRATLAGFVQLRLEALTQRTRELRVRFDFGKRTHELPWSELSGRAAAPHRALRIPAICREARDAAAPRRDRQLRRIARDPAVVASTGALDRHRCHLSKTRTRKASGGV